MTMEGPQNSHVKKETQKNEKCHGPSDGPGRAGCYGTHFNAGMSIAMKSIISVVPFTMRTKNLHVIKKKIDENPEELEQEFVCIPWRLILEEPACKMELSGSYICCTELTYIIHLEGFSLKRFSYSAIYYACSNVILFHTIAV